MIKNTFYNLPDEKRERIISAVMKEFAQSENGNVSINRIIADADISRGSFYQYFDDKIDLVEVLKKALVDMTISSVYQALSVSNGDIFYTYEVVFDVIVDLGKDEEKRIILKNLCGSLRVNNTLISEYLMSRCSDIEELKILSSRFDRDNFRFRSQEDLEALQQTLTLVIKNAFFNYFVKEMDYDTVKSNYLRKLEIIKMGALLS